MLHLPLLSDCRAGSKRVGSTRASKEVAISEAYSTKALAAEPEQAESENTTQKDNHTLLSGPTEDRLPVHLLQRH
jgi:hypothetical protein